MRSNQDEDREINRNWVETNEEFPMNYYVMESVGHEELDNFFKGLVPMLRNLKKAQYEIKVKTDNFIRRTEADLFENFTLKDAIMSMIYCCLATLQSSDVFQYIESSPYFSFKGKLSHQNALIYKSWIELAEILTWASLQLKHQREFDGALEIQKLYPTLHLSNENFNRNMRRLEKAKQFAIETHSQVNDNLRIINSFKSYTASNAHAIPSKAYNDKQLTPSEIIIRYWPEQHRVIGKVRQSILRMNSPKPPGDKNPEPLVRIYEESKQVAPVLRMNLAPPLVDGLPRPLARVDEESKQVASASEDNLLAYSVFPLQRRLLS
jgi:hypothetical protein